MTVYDNSESCGRVSSISIFNSEGNYVEVGWYEDPDGGIEVCQATTGKPRVLVYAHQFGNTYGCKQNTPTLNHLDVWAFRVSDLNEDTVWGYWWGSTDMGTYNLWFRTGDPVAQGERHTLATTNHASARFTGLQYSPGSGTTWTGWQGDTIWKDNDRDYKGCNYGNVTVTVIHVSNSC
jgi:hypothetical protein